MQSWRTTLFRYVLFLSVLCLPMAANAISVTLDSPNQSVAAPSSGITTLTFSGTVVVDTFFSLNTPSVDNPTNSLNTFALVATLDGAFAGFAATTFGGTYTGNVFSVDVPTGTPVDLYAYFFGSGSSQIRLNEYTAGGNVDDASAAFSVNVTGGSSGGPGGNAVPENGGTLLFSGISLSAVCLARRRLA
jgi:hypothetical protein